MLACFIALFVTQTTQPTITYTNFGARTEVVLADLSRITGTHLTAAPNMVDVPLTLRLKEAPSRLALDKIADVSGGRWHATSQGAVLSFDQDTFDKQEAIRQDRLASDRLLGLKQWIKDLPADDAATAHVLKELDWDELCHIPAGHFIYFGAPTRPLVRPLPTISEEDFNELKDIDDDHEGDKVPQSEIDQRRICFQFENHLNEVQMTFYVTDKFGNRLTKPFLNRFIPDYHPDDNDRVGREENPFKVSDDLEAVRNNLYPDYIKTAAAKAHLANPLRYDPSAALGEYFVRFAKMKQAQFVGSVFPGQIEHLEWHDRRKVESSLGPSDIEEFLHRYGANFSNQWISFNRLPVPQTRQALPPTQRLLKKFIDTLKPGSVPTYQELSKAYSNGFDAVHDQLAITHLFPEFAEQYTSNAPFLKLISQFPADQLAQLIDGSQISMGSLPPNLQNDLLDAIYGARYFELNDETLEQNDSDGHRLSTIPYECLTPHINRNIALQLKHTKDSALRFSDSESVYEIGEISDYINESTYSDPKELPAQVGTEDKWTIIVGITQYSRLNINGTFYSFPNKKFVEPKNFPDSLKKRISKMKKEREAENQSSGGTPEKP